MSRFKRATSRLYYRVLGALGDVQMEPGSADFLLMDRAVVDTINRFENQELFLRGLVRWLGLPDRQGQLPARTAAAWRQQIFGRPDGRARALRHRRAQRAAAARRHLAGAGFAALGLLFVVYSIVSFFFVQHTVAGWTSIMAAIAILGAAQLFVLGIIGEYVGRILRETRRRPNYVVAETEADRQHANADERTADQRAASNQRLTVDLLQSGFRPTVNLPPMSAIAC